MRPFMIAVLLAGGFVPAAFAKEHVYRTGVVEKVIFQERLDSTFVELVDRTAPPALMGFVHLSIRSGQATYTATMYAYRPDDYPLTLRPGQIVHYRISQEQYIECDVHAVMTMRQVTQLTLRSPKGHLWPTEIAPLVVPAPALPPSSLRLLPSAKK